MHHDDNAEFLAKNARWLVYAAAFIIACATGFIYAKGWSATSEMGNAFGFLSFSFISICLAVSPIRALFPSFKYNAVLYAARRAFGVSGFVFASIHYATPAYVYYKGNLAFFLAATGDFGLWVWVGVASLAALFLLAATSADYAVKKMGRKWFTLHKLGYLAYLLIIAHAYSIGSDFGGSGLNAYSGSFLFIAAATLLLEAARAYVSFSKARQKAA